jgi:hypothetical protein
VFIAHFIDFQQQSRRFALFTQQQQAFGQHFRAAAAAAAASAPGWGHRPGDRHAGSEAELSLSAQAQLHHASMAFLAEARHQQQQQAGGSGSLEIGSGNTFGPNGVGSRGVDAACGEAPCIPARPALESTRR